MRFEREIEHMLRRVLHSQGPLHLLDVLWWKDERRCSVIIEARFDGDYRSRVHINLGELTYRERDDFVGRNQGHLNLQSMWSRMAEDFRMQQAAREQDEALRVLAMAAPDQQTFYGIAEYAQTVRRHVEQYHTTPARFDLDGPEVYSSARPIQMRAQEVRERIGRELTNRFDRMATDMLRVRQSTTTTVAGEASEITAEAVRQALETLSRNGMPLRFAADFGMGEPYAVWNPPGSISRDVGTKEAQEKGKKLLMEHLTDDQRQDYEKTKTFTVTAQSGTKYRIREGRQMNIDVLDESGQRKGGICFLPEGQLVAGDCMLAQKIALETCEDLALSVANKFG